jgi:predicted enzyme related to lactoylglutathione lyase
MTSEPHRRAIGSLRAVALDAPDIGLLATFYEQLAGWRRVPDDDDEWITIDSGDGWRIGLQRATGHVPPHWPDQDRPQQAHLDFRVPDIDAAAERAQQLGASLLRRSERWHTLADPAGHPFDLCVNTGDPRTTLMAVMLDCPDAKALSHFYAELVGKPVTYEADGVAMIGEDRAAGDGPAGRAVHRAALAGSGVPAADPPRRDRPGRGRGGTGRPRHRCHPTGRRRPELARLRRSGRQAILPGVDGLIRKDAVFVSVAAA